MIQTKPWALLLLKFLWILHLGAEQDQAAPVSGTPANHQLIPSQCMLLLMILIMSEMCYLEAKQHCPGDHFSLQIVIVKKIYLNV